MRFGKGFKLVWLMAFSGSLTFPVHAQDLTGGLSPWSAIGGLAPQSAATPWAGLGLPTTPSPLSPWSGLAAPLGSAGLSPWSGLAAPLGSAGLSPWSALAAPSPLGAMPYGYGTQYLNQLPALGAPYAQYYQPPGTAWQTPLQAPTPLGCSSGGVAGSFQPDLTGTWRGSGGETVQIERNRARIWGGEDQPCNCVFFLVGERMIAYSPDTDRVRKYWYQDAGDQFTLIDEAGNLLTFRRVH